MPHKPHRLFYGDNLEVLPTIASDSVDMVYLDPPFNSQQDYNLLFREYDGSKAAAQRLVFTDTWSWRPETAIAFRRITEVGGPLAKCMVALRAFLGETDLMAYLVMMAPRLQELHRVLKPSGSLYLHCDPTASHYLKVLLDAVFGEKNFINEIVWQRTNAHNMRTKGFVRSNDVLLYYAKTLSEIQFNEQYTAYGPEQLKRYKPDEKGRLYKAENLTFSTANPSRQFEWRGARPPANRSWGYSIEKLEELWAAGLIVARRDGTPRMDGLKVYLAEMKGKPVTTNWTDIPRVSNTSGERLGYPTQKPEALLARIINASTSEGDTVLDPFCGCGTTIAVAHKLHRKWIGIDVTARAIDIVEERLEAVDANARDTYELHGKPRTLEDARRLAKDNGYQFQRWILELMDVLPREIKPGADGGVDGRLYFVDAPSEGRTSEVIFSVKGGKNIGPDPVRSLAGITKGRAKIGVFVCFKATDAMYREVSNADPFVSIHGEFPSLQILTVADVLAGKRPHYPGAPSGPVTKRAPRLDAEQLELKPTEQLTLVGIAPRMARARLHPQKQKQVPIPVRKK
jgi:site-specific DNA-methyltransferase (adenine-specific)